MFAGGIFAGKVFDDDGPRYLLVAGTYLHVDQHLQDLLSDPVEPSSLLRHRRLARFQSCVFKCMTGLFDARNVGQLSRLF